MEAELLYVTKPSDSQLEGIKNFVRKEYKNQGFAESDTGEVDINLIEDASLNCASASS